MQEALSTPMRQVPKELPLTLSGSSLLQAQIEGQNGEEKDNRNGHGKSVQIAFDNGGPLSH
jgi:hypothetical protein